MENKKSQKLSVTALIISMLPLATFVPRLFNMALTDTVRSIWVGTNILSVFGGLVLSIICIKNRDSRSVINTISTVISSFWIVLMCGIIILALFIHFIQQNRPYTCLTLWLASLRKRHVTMSAKKLTVPTAALRFLSRSAQITIFERSMTYIVKRILSFPCRLIRRQQNKYCDPVSVEPMRGCNRSGAPESSVLHSGILLCFLSILV